MEEQNTPQTPRTARGKRKKARRRTDFAPLRSALVTIIACILCIAITAGVMCLMFFNRFGGVANYKMARKLMEVKEVIDQNYIGESDPTAMENGAAAAMVTSLGDQWSYYMTPEEYKAYLMYSANEYAGIGVTIQPEVTDGGFKIVSVTAQSPAESAGLVAGDVILAVDGTDVSSKTLSEVQQLIRAKLDKTITFSIRGEDGHTRTVSVDCTVIHTDPVSFKMLENNVGYVQINNFESGCGDSAIKAIDQLLSDGAGALVFDVRNNPGGKLSELITLLDHILPEGDLFVGVDRSGKETVTKSDNVCVKVPMSVIVNANTYSAAEFFAAALHEYDWAVIVGENTTGKGRSQTTELLSDGSAVHISSNKYLTPQRVDLSEQGGLIPDQTVTPGDDPEVDQQLNAAISAVLN